jgi:coiled-coil domain-containing protein 15
VNVPDIYPGVVGEEMKKQTVAQRAMFRRLFMDIEREQVKEVKRKKEHRKRIVL